MLIKKLNTIIVCFLEPTLLHKSFNYRTVYCQRLIEKKNKVKMNAFICNERKVLGKYFIFG